MCSFKSLSSSQHPDCNKQFEYINETVKDFQQKNQPVISVDTKKKEAVNGCCYGRDNKPDKGDYYKYCGQNFWEFISGNDNLYTDIIDPIGFKAKERNERFVESYSKMINKFTVEFAKEFCKKNGEIDWQRMKRKIRKFKTLCAAGQLDLTAVRQSLAGRLGHARHGQTYHLRAALLQQLCLSKREVQL